MAGVWSSAVGRQAVEDAKRKREAAERAELYAPTPTGGPWLAGLCGATVAMVALYTIGKVYALPLGENWVPVVMITLASFLVVCVGYRRARERNRKARVAEADMDLERGGVILPIDQVEPGDRS
jgi:hypothetical protein